MLGFYKKVQGPGNYLDLFPGRILCTVCTASLQLRHLSAFSLLLLHVSLGLSLVLLPLWRSPPYCGGEIYLSQTQRAVLPEVIRAREVKG